LQRQYKNHLSDYTSWDQHSHAEQWLLFKDNIGEHLGIDETSLSNGELYTLVTNKSAKGQKGTIVAIIKGTKSEDVISVLNKIQETKRNVVQEVTLDMAANMNLIIKRCFPKATRVIDRFHVQRLVLEAVQSIRIKYRWMAIEEDNIALANAKKTGEEYSPKIFSNGDTVRQLLARSRHLLFKPESKWTSSQLKRAKILFNQFPEIEQAYRLAQSLSYIYENNYDKRVAIVKLAKWYNQVEDSGFKEFNIASKSIQLHYQGIVNFFDNRSTNASAESFNAKLKDFRREFKGVRDVRFFLFRLTQIFA